MRGCTLGCTRWQRVAVSGRIVRLQNKCGNLDEGEHKAEAICTIMMARKNMPLAELGPLNNLLKSLTEVWSASKVAGATSRAFLVTYRLAILRELFAEGTKCIEIHSPR